MIYAGAAPRKLRVLEGQCRSEGEPRAIVQLEGRGRRTRSCYAEGAPRCRDHQELELSCEAPVVLSTPGGAPRTFGHLLKVKARGGRLQVVARVEVEGYVAAVVHKELGNAPLEARRAQAILARTYAARAKQEPRHEGAPLCDAQHCQAFAGLFHSKYGKQIDPAPAQSTLSEILIESDEQPTPVFFHAACGGRTIAANRLWPGAQAPELVAVDDLAPDGSAWCKQSPHHRWRAKLEAADLGRALLPLVERSLDPRTLRLEREDDDGVVWRIGDRAGIRRVPGARLQSTLGRAFGYEQVRSARFTARRRGGTVVLEGEGLGHGVGLCQAGAAARAKAGQDAHAILEAYFPKLRLKTGPWR